MDLKSALKTTYGGIEIEYIEADSKWRFELRGRERKADSLKQAKEWIDKPEPVKKTKANIFHRFEAVFASGWGEAGYRKKERITVTVTSAAAAQYRYDQSSEPTVAWIQKKDGSRSKENVERLFQITPDNAALWLKYDTLQEDIDRLNNEAKTVLKKLKRVDLTQYVGEKGEPEDATA